MKIFENIILKKESTLREAIEKIDSSGLQLAVVLDNYGRLLGLISDGDIRRAILRGNDMSDTVANVMNSNPVTASPAAQTNELLAIMRKKSLHHIPIVDDHYRLVDLVTLDLLAGMSPKLNWVVLMAGGLGTRLRPLTDSCPKPMLSVGGKPILENILDKFIEQGFCQFYISVNYMAETIQEYFGDGSRYGVNIRYIHESKRLGTAGALSLLPEHPNNPVIVMNGDLLTELNFDQVLKFHNEHQSVATMTVRDYEIQVPYGVVNIDDDSNFCSIEEKPVHRFFVNAGIYILAPEAFEHIPKNTFYDMPTLIQTLKKNSKKVSAYLLHEYWLDVGRLEELERAQSEWPLVGGGK